MMKIKKKNKIKQKFIFKIKSLFNIQIINMYVASSFLRTYLYKCFDNNYKICTQMRSYENNVGLRNTPDKTTET